MKYRTRYAQGVVALIAWHGEWGVAEKSGREWGDSGSGKGVNGCLLNEVGRDTHPHTLMAYKYTQR